MKRKIRFWIYLGNWSIDGTRSYIAGHRDFGNLISLLLIINQ